MMELFENQEEANILIKLIKAELYTPNGKVIAYHGSFTQTQVKILHKLLKRVKAHVRELNQIKRRAKLEMKAKEQEVLQTQGKTAKEFLEGLKNQTI